MSEAGNRHQHVFHIYKCMYGFFNIVESYSGCNGSYLLSSVDTKILSQREVLTLIIVSHCRITAVINANVFLAMSRIKAPVFILDKAEELIPCLCSLLFLSLCSST